MKSNKNGKTKAKGKGLHPRNVHRERYDFEALIKSSPELSVAVVNNAYGDLSVDFSNPKSVKLLNQALLKHYYQVEFWDIPDGYLCPPIPGRADYLHYLADLLASTRVGGHAKAKDKTIPKGKNITAFDVGMGANCVYPILGSRLFGWNFVGSDVDSGAVNLANTLVDSNAVLKGRIGCRVQASAKHIFKGVMLENERFDVTLCNPPFHASLAEATEGSQRKVANLAANTAKKRGQSRVDTRGGPSIKAASNADRLNFGGQGAELWCPGGEAAFIECMILESAERSKQCLWFSCLVAKKDHLPAIYKTLKKVKAADVRTINMSQGQKITRIVAWTFHSPDEQANWCRTRW